VNRIDEQMLQLLKRNGRMSSPEISRHVHLSESIKQITGVVKTNTMIVVLSTMKEEL